MSNAWSFETKQIHAGQSPDGTTNARALPIYQTTSYTFNDTTHAANLFGLKELGNIYTRIMNPTQAVVEDRIAALEGGVAGLLVASGQAAETLADPEHRRGRRPHRVQPEPVRRHLQPLPLHAAEARHHDARSSRTRTIRSRGVRPCSRTPSCSSASRSPTRRTTSSTSRRVATVAHEVGVPLIIDNTVATPYLIRPFEWGADIVVHSATKYIGGHGTSVAGVIVDAGTFDYAQYPERFPNYNQPDPSYHGLVYARDLGVGSAFGANLSFILKARVQLLRDLGAAVSPFNAFLIAQGLETLSLRIERHVENAKVVAEWLEGRDEVESVNYAGLTSSPWYERGQKYAPLGTGAVLSFEIKGGVEAGRAFVEALELHSHVANIGDVRSLVIHPASTTHSQLTPEEQAAAGVTPGLVRLAVGIENIDDILADLDAGFRAAKQA